eukprot:Gb_04308 [translate_table: standard]
MGQLCHWKPTQISPSPQTGRWVGQMLLCQLSLNPLSGFPSLYLWHAAFLSGK